MNGYRTEGMLVVYKSQARNRFVRSYRITLGGREAREGRAWRKREMGGSEAQWCTAVTRKGKGLPSCRHTNNNNLLFFVIIIIVVVGNTILISPRLAKEPETWAPGYDCRAPPGRFCRFVTELLLEKFPGESETLHNMWCCIITSSRSHRAPTMERSRRLTFVSPSLPPTPHTTLLLKALTGTIILD
jgi:hypothetical protein